MTVNRNNLSNFAEDSLAIIAGLTLLIWGVVDYEYGIKFGLGLGILAFGVRYAWEDIKKVRTNKQG